jgi:hypothetical protein
MNKTILLLAIALTLFLAQPSIAQSNTCPDTIPVKQELRQSIPGWQVFPADSPVRLEGVTFFDGSPHDKASLVYDQTTRAGGKEIMTWHFLPNKDRQIWMSCRYSGTSIAIARSLPNDTRHCSVAYNPKITAAGLPLIEKIDCK